jgi:predicted DNA-binding transcriptional regulator AlpA
MARPKVRFDLPPRKPRQFRAADPASKFIRPVNIPAETGLSLSTILRMEQAGDFPARVQLSANSVAWTRESVEAWQANRQARNAA